MNSKKLTLSSESLVFELIAGDDLRAVSWDNRLRGKTLHFRGGKEFSVVTDTSTSRVGITGWRGMRSADVCSAPDEEPGYRAGFWDLGFDDSGWSGLMATVAEGPWTPEQTFWARTEILLPMERFDQDVTLVLGGCGLFDFDFIRVFVNGVDVGTRRERSRWREPGRFCFPVGDAARAVWKFGEANLIAVQQTEYRGRNAEIDAVDPRRTRQLPLKCQWPVPWEQYVIFGIPEQTEHFVVESMEGDGASCQVVARSDSLEATLRYCLNGLALTKTLTLKNRSCSDLRILHVGLGEYEVDGVISDGEQGFPVYLDNAYFFGLAHPSGFATGCDGRVKLDQHPGVDLVPDETWQSMQAVLGVGDASGARAGFHAYLRKRMRRIRLPHTKPLAIIEPFGAKTVGTTEEYERFWNFGYFDESEEFLLSHLDKVAATQEQTGCQFDAYFIDFWNAYSGGLDEPDPVRFPRGFEPVFSRIRELGMEPGLWIDSSWERWSCGGNPAVADGLTHDPAFGTDRPTLCRATEPYRSMFTEAFVLHVKHHGVRYLKFDNLQTCCFNPDHPHLPGRHAAEAIQSAVIETLRAVDSACPDVFIMLYWGHRSPWWLLYADTLFEPGLLIEAAHAGSSPTLYARDSVTVGLDQAHRFCRDIPSPGKDSLGVWMSEWKWNSCLGTERWAEAVVMDLGRGSLLLQPWSNPDFLDPEGRAILARLWHLLRTFPACFANPRWILGDPWRNEPYGYVCSDEVREFVGIHNASWDYLHLKPQDLGVTGDSTNEWVRWFPERARWGCPPAEAVIELAPFDVVLFEVAASGVLSKAAKQYPLAQWPSPSGRATRVAPVQVNEEAKQRAEFFPRPPGALPPVPADAHYENRTFELTVAAGEGALHLSVEMTRDGLPLSLEDAGSHFDFLHAGAVPVIARHAFSTPWQAWRISEKCSLDGVSAVLRAILPHKTECHFSARRL